MSDIAAKLTAVADNIQKVYEAGKKSEYDRFWDAYQNYGERIDYSYSFSGIGWTADIFDPKYAIKPTNCTMMFAYSALDVDVFSHPKFDFSKTTLVTQMFSYSAFTKLGTYTANGDNGLRYMFHYAQKLKSIDKIIVAETNFTDYYQNAFSNCKALEEVRFEGVIAHTGLNFNWSPLSVASMKNIILHLKNYAGTANEGQYTIQFSSGCWDALEAESTAPDGGTWKDYVTFTLGWEV